MSHFKALRTGYTDIDSTDIWKFSIHSDYPTQKIFSASSTSATILAGNQGIEGQTVGNPPVAKTIAHNLGYVPRCKVSVVRTSINWSGSRLFRISGSQTQFDETDVLGRVYSVTADTTNINIYIYNTVDAQPSDRIFTIHYIIQYDQAI